MSAMWAVRTRFRVVYFLSSVCLVNVNIHKLPHFIVCLADCPGGEITSEEMTLVFLTFFFIRCIIASALFGCNMEVNHTAKFHFTKRFFKISAIYLLRANYPGLASLDGLMEKQKKSVQQ